MCHVFGATATSRRKIYTYGDGLDNARGALLDCFGGGELLAFQNAVNMFHVPRFFCILWVVEL